MQRRAQLIIGFTVIALGLGVVALGFLDEEARVRQVAEVMANPDGHRSGSYTLIGIPQPPELRSLDATQTNPEYTNQTTWSEGWNGYHTTHTMHVEVDESGSSWTYTNRTQEAGRPETATSSTTSWRIDSPHTVFLIQGFPDGAGETPAMWGIYDGVIRDPVQPKPSQFEGRLTANAGGANLPRGALLFEITEFTAGCSSKFLPEDYEESA